MIDNPNNESTQQIDQNLASGVDVPLLNKPKIPFRHTWWRWVALLLINLMVVGSFMTLEGPQPIETQIKKILDIDDQQYSLLYSVWAFPSIITPFLGGYLIDKYGIRPMLISFAVFVAGGQIIYAYGGYSLNFILMLVGRAVYAVGTDPINVAQIFITNKWFQEKELGLAMSISGATFGLGRGLNSFITPILYDIADSITLPMVFGALLCVIGMFIAIIMAKWDEVNEKRELIMDETYLAKISGEKAKLSDCKYFKWIVWLLVFNFAIIHSYALSFNAIANDFYHINYGFTNVEAGIIITMSFVFFAISGIFFGKIIDKYGKRASILTWNSLLGVICFIYFLVFQDCHRCLSTVIPQILIGSQQGIAEGAIYTSLPIILEEKFLGTGYGLFFVFENILIFIMPPVAAYIMKETASGDDQGYFGMLLFFFVCSWLVVAAGVALLVEDKKKDRKLDNTITTEETDKESKLGNVQ